MEAKTSEVKGLVKEIFGIGLFGKLSSKKMKASDSEIVILSHGLSSYPTAVVVPAYGKIYVTKKRYERKTQKFIREYNERFNESLSVERAYPHNYFSESGWMTA